MNNMYDYVIRKEFVGNLVYNVKEDDISLVDDINGYCNAKIIDNYCEGYLSAPTQVFAEVTDNCLLKCKHCFNGDRRNNTEMPLASWKTIIDRLDECGVFRVRISGGEPFCRNDIIDILKYLDTKLIRYSIYSSGFFLDRFINDIQLLKNLVCIRVSIDGTKEINDAIRGEGVYQQAIEAIQLLEKNNIPCQINFTIAKTNYKSLGLLAEELKNMGIQSNIHVGFLKIGGRAKENLEMCFTDDVAFEKQAEEIKDCINSHDNIAEYVLLRPLYNKIYGNAIGCPGGRISAVIRANGVVCPCGSIADEKFCSGNIVDVSMLSLWHHENMDQVRRVAVRDECLHCKYLFKNCTGGCLANPYNYFGDIGEKDINCATYRAFCKIDI